MKNFHCAQEVREMLDLGSRRTEHMRIQSMDAELEAKGYWGEWGKVPVS